MLALESVFFERHVTCSSSFGQSQAKNNLLIFSAYLAG
jgi:hypothetical protein